MVRFSWLQDILIKACMPFYFIYLTVVLLVLLKPERNGFKSVEINRKLTNYKNV